MQLSAIVPTHDRPVALRRCLESLQAQTVERSSFEVVVVDDGSFGDVAGLLDTVASQGPVVMRCERQPPSGLNTARNLGVSVAVGDVIAFLDDDTLVAPGWAAALLSAFGSNPCDAVGGRVELALDGPAPEWLGARRYYLAEYDLGPESRWIEGDDPVPVGANCAIRRGVLDRVGGFHPGLDRIGTSLISNGDTELFRRLQARGGKLRYEPRASVTHCVASERLTVAYFLKRHYAQGVSDELLLTIQGQPPTLSRQAAVARKLLSELAPIGNRLCRDVLRGRGTVMARFDASYLVGRLRGAAMAVPGQLQIEPKPSAEL